MESIIEGCFIVLYVLASACLMFFGLHCYIMIGLFVTKHKTMRKRTQQTIDLFAANVDERDLPIVTFQLPVYNEAEVIKRLITSTAAVDYPKDKFEIQIVDDSTDETVTIIDSFIEKVKAETGVDIYAVRRDNRKDFKAGALAEAMLIAKGEYMAIFDSDFVCPENFLRRAIASIHSDKKMACIQGRWGHLNRNENWLTRAQSVGIDGHFAAEQGARSYADLCMNFNGTAGIWRKQAIYDAGGWQGDTLTEDLDLSYRAQMAGYTIKYDFDLECKAEIPNNVTALKSQQKRWAKGSMETALKLIPRVFKSDLPFKNKIEAFMHMTHYFVAVLMVVMCLCTLPVLLYAPTLKGGMLLNFLWGLIIVSAVAPCVMYTGSGIILKRGMYSLTHFPAMLAMGTGLCINNAFAVIDAFSGRKTEFVRTPKSGSEGTVKKRSRYKSNGNLYQAIIETVLGLYCTYTFVIYTQSNKFIFGFFIGAYAIGLLTFGINTLYGTLSAVFSKDSDALDDVPDADLDPA